MRRVLDRIFRRFMARHVHVAVLRDPTKSPEQIRAFLDELMPAVEAGKLTSEQFDQKQKEFYGTDPKMIFVGYAGRDKKGAFRLIDMQTGEFLDLPLSGDIVIPIREFEAMLQHGDIAKLEKAGQSDNGPSEAVSS